MNHFKRSIAAVAVSAILGMSTAYAADGSHGFLMGKAKDPQGQVLNNVTIKIVNVETGLTRSYTSSDEGGYRFPLLPTGTYKVLATKEGYQAYSQTISVGLGGKTIINPQLTAGNMEVIEVSGSALQLVDLTSTSTGLVIDQAMINRIPVARDITSVALLAPTTSLADESLTSRTPLVAIGGASAAENIFYVNGMNITDARRGLGASVVPFEMYKDFEILTGAYSAEFGRSLGGVINATTKSGTNEFHFGGNVYLEPESLQASTPDSLRTNGEFYRINSQDKEKSFEGDIWASGAIVQDKLFFYALYQAQDKEWQGNPAARTSQYQIRKNEDPFFGVKLDWYLTDDHLFEFTYFKDTDDEEVEVFDFDSETMTVGARKPSFTNEWGGDTKTLKYTGILTDNITFSAQYGTNESASSTLPPSELLVNAVTQSGNVLNSWAADPSIEDTERKLFRMDLDYYWGDHTFRIGYDQEKYDAFEDTHNAGPNNYGYEIVTNNDTGVTTVIRDVYVNKGSFKTESAAWYITDSWQVTDTVVLNLGVRNDTFDSFNVAGKKFISIDDQIAPRIGVTWDVNGDGDSKLYANFARYYIPVPGQTNVRLGGAELNYEERFAFLGLDGNNAPILGEQIGERVDFDDGVPGDPRALADNDLKPMYQDELVLGYDRNLGDNWSMGIYLVARELGQGFEDTDTEGALENFFQDEFGSGCAGSNCSYVLLNPGRGMQLHIDPDRVMDANGNLVSDGPIPEGDYSIPASYIGLPEIERKYYGATFSLDRAWDDVWMMNVAYTWSHSYGNHEGLVNSDLQQEDAGITINFDYPGLVDNAYGNLPTDRRHAVKFFGSYAITEDLTVGVSAQWASGRPRNATGYFPITEDSPTEDIIASYYRALSFYTNGEPSPRGSLGTTSSTFKVNASMVYNLDFMGSDVTLRADVFNVLNAQKPVTFWERTEDFGDFGPGPANNPGYVPGSADNRFGSPRNYQSPRYVRFSASIAF
jgi:hypothetical protein